MKTRYLLFGMAATSILVLSGCSKPSSHETPAQTDSDKGTMTDDQLDDEKTDTGTLPGEGMMTDSYRALLQSGKQLKCTVSMNRPDGGVVESASYLDGEKRYKMVMNDPKIGKATTLFDGTTVYSWTEGKTIGMKMESSCIDDLKKQANETNAADSAYKSNDDLLENAPDISCAESDESVDFSVPSNVQFTDQCEMMKQVKNMMNAMPSKADATSPAVPQ